MMCVCVCVIFYTKSTYSSPFCYHTSYICVHGSKNACRDVCFVILIFVCVILCFDILKWVGVLSKILISQFSRHHIRIECIK